MKYTINDDLCRGLVVEVALLWCKFFALNSLNIHPHQIVYDHKRQVTNTETDIKSTPNDQDINKQQICLIKFYIFILRGVF